MEATFAGPSCDSLDIMFRGKLTVRQEVGDLLLVPSCGAYTSASATTFNGFSKANFIVWEEFKRRNRAGSRRLLWLAEQQNIFAPAVCSRSIFIAVSRRLQR